MCLKLLITGENRNSDYNRHLQIKVLRHIKSHIQEPNYKLCSRVYLEDNKKIKLFLKCSLEYSQFINRLSSVSQKNYQIGNN